MRFGSQSRFFSCLLLSFETGSFGGLRFGSQSRFFSGLLLSFETGRFGIRVYQHFAIFLRFWLRLYQLGTRAHCCSCQLRAFVVTGRGGFLAWGHFNAPLNGRYWRFTPLKSWSDW